MRIVDGAILEGKQLTWTMDPLFVPTTGGNPVFRGSWTHSTTHNNYFETSGHYGAYGFEGIGQQPTQTSATTEVDESGECAIRINLPPIGINKGRVRVAVEDFEGNPVKVADMEVPVVVVIDPGHGGTDSGAVGSDGTTLEKDFTLAYGLDLQDELRDALDERQPFHRVLITRSLDVRVELVDRPPIARDAGADVFVSVHFNSGASAARGTETFVERTEAESIATGDRVNNPGDNHNVEEDETLANSANTETFDAVAASDTAASNRGVQHAGKYVTRDLYNGNLTGYCPLRSCLIEVEFISNAAALASLSGANAGAIRSAFSENVASAIITDIEEQPNP
jgi:N-acetylmuramoyl-L-alanine amidase